MKKVIPFILAAAMLLQLNAFAYAIREKRSTGSASATDHSSANDVFYDDYTAENEGSLPGGYIAGGLSNGKVEIRKTKNADGAEKNTLALVDEVDGGSSNYNGVMVSRGFEKQTGRFAVEWSFKYEPISAKNTSYQMYLRQGTDIAARIVAWSGNGILTYYNESTQVVVAENAMLTPNEWYTVRIVIDMESKTADVRTVANPIKSGNVTATEINKDTGAIVQRDLPLYSAFRGDGIDNIYFETQVHDGIYYMDYLKVEEKAEPMEELERGARPDPILAPVLPDPVQHAVRGRVNLQYNGDYVYYHLQPVIKNSATLIPVGELCKAMGISQKTDGDKITLERNGKSLVLKPDKLEEKDGEMFTYLRDAAAYFGAEVSWDNDTQTVIINEEAAK